MLVARRWGRLAPAGPLLVALGVVIAVRAAVSYHGYLYFDDFAFRYWAATEPLNWAYLTKSYGGHVNPVGLLAQWWLQSVFPGSHLALATFSLVMFAVALGFLGLVLQRLTGRRLAAVLGVVIAGVSLFGFEVTVWWAGAIYAGPYQAFLMAGVYAALRLREGGATRWALASVFCAVGMALSFSRGFLGILVMCAVVAALPDSTGRPAGLRRTVNASPAAWTAMAAASGGGALFVLTRAQSVTRPGFDAADLPLYVWKLLTLNVLPAIWGGPWRWYGVAPELWDPIVATPDPSPPMVWASVAASVIGVLAIWVWRRELRPLLIVAVGYAMLVLLIAGFARSGTLVASVAYRYTFDLVWPVTLLVVLAIVPRVGERRGVWRPGVLLVAVTVVLALVSTVVPARYWAGNQAKDYMANARAGFDSIPQGQFVLNQGVPDDLIHPALMAQYANAEVVFTPEPGAPVFGPYAQDTLFGFAPDGSVQMQDVLGPTSNSGPEPDCGYRVTNLPRSVALDGQLIGWAFYARVAYYTGTPTILNLAVGGMTHSVPLQAGGLRVVYFPVNGPGSDVLVSSGNPGVTVCVTEIRIGNRVTADTEEVVPLPINRLPHG